MSLDEAVAGCSRHTGRRRLPAAEQPTQAQYEAHGAWVVSARGAYDMNSVEPLADALKDAAEKSPKVVLDASGITFADSTLLSLLILTHQATDFRVAAPTWQVVRLMQLTGVDAFLKVRATVEEAAAA
ncbi:MULTISPECIES: STAS domain-containing protein [Streptomyces]|uniref:STAS domain-containing protein n=2 Tax=Streptomyces rochei group TaxID=2867164 RepID=A0ABW7EE78_STRRO|nr:MULTISPECIES: STAS domain-containing protein [Streptomyces]MCC8448861.1 STAS domain-containing protein [Streptomyces rochei]MDV6287309.1 STAS domain-containing protein [Streptomyces sp. UP1A-1]GGY80177.1 anti-sigma factor antagonist [Streptomyces geysiriensis]GGZ59274.1 anti-sigma factor antagonist [Streptomyces plicatus]